MSRKLIHQEEEENVIFLASYADFITFLAMFFLLLFVLTYNDKKDETFLPQLRMYFNNPDYDGTKVVRSQNAFVSSLNSYIREERLNQYAMILVDEQRIRVIMNDPVLFDVGSADLKPESKKILQGLGAIIKKIENPIMVEGHTDSPHSGSQDYDSWELSFQRAYSVLKFLNQGGVPAKQMAAVGYAHYHPLVPNSSHSNRAKNRRVEINIVRVTETTKK